MVNNQSDRPEINYGIVLARVIAIVLVVLLHSAAGPVGAKSANNWEWAVAYSAVSKQCIGIFFIISGFVYADKNFEFKSFIKKGIESLFIPLAFWWIVYAWYLIVFKNVDVSTFNIMKPSSVHLWFMYDYIAVYLFIPLITVGCRNIQTRYAMFIFSVLFYSASLQPSLAALDVSVPRISIPFASTLMFYVFIGYIAARKKDIVIKYRTAFLLSTIVLTVASIFINKAMLTGEIKNITLSNFSPIIAVTAASTTLACIGYNDMVKSFSEKFVIKLSLNAFGIYLVHPLIIFVTWRYIPITNYTWGIPLATIFYILISLLVTIAFSKIPFLRKTI